MITTNKKQIKEKYNDYKKSNGFTLYDIYRTHSHEKAKAFAYCVALCKQYNGECLKIVSYNQNMFTMGFTYTNDNGEKMFVYITKANDYQTKIED